jgi:mxaJ protein
LALAPPSLPSPRRGEGAPRSFTVALALAITLFVCAPASARTLRVCADPNNLPFSNERGEGFENRIVALVAEELGAEVEYTWRAQRRGFLRETLRARSCDVVPGLPSNLEGLRTTAPYYSSTYVFATRADGPTIDSLNDPRLRDLTIGVQLIGDDGANAPPAHALSRRGLVDNVRGYTVYGDYREPNPPARIIEAVARGDIDVAAVWGPLAGYFATRQGVPLKIAPVRPAFDGPQLPMVWDISMGVRKDDDELRREIDAALARRRADIDVILSEYGVPRPATLARLGALSPLVGEAESRSDREGGTSASMEKFAPVPPSPTLPHKGGEGRSAQTGPAERARAP